MQKTLLLLSFILYFSQSLEGQWEGWNTNMNSKDTTVFKLQFQLNKDSTYDVYSFSKFKNFKGVCRMLYRMLSTRSVYLEETEVVRTTIDSPKEIVLQKMTLDITNGFRTMKGKWQSTDPKFNNSGTVFLLKSNLNKYRFTNLV